VQFAFCDFQLFTMINIIPLVAFNMMDCDKDGYLKRNEFHNIVQSMYRSLGNVELELANDVPHFVDRIFPDGVESISCAQYKEATLKNVMFVQSMGLLSDNGDMREKKEYGVIRMHNKHISLGSENWDMCQHLMLGIRKAV
jgi:hypothetical protein